MATIQVTHFDQLGTVCNEYLGGISNYWCITIFTAVEVIKDKMAGDAKKIERSFSNVFHQYTNIDI